MTILLILIPVLLFAGLLFLILRLNTYIEKLETLLKDQITLTENLLQSMREVIAEDYLQNDGRLKKFSYQKEDRKVIYNGRVVEENIEV